MPTTLSLLLGKREDTFRTVMQEYEKYKKDRNLSPRKQERVLHTLFYYDEKPEDLSEEIGLSNKSACEEAGVNVGKRGE